MNKKGFTLTELLVVVVIIGIIAGISIPLIRNLSTGFEKKKYENYAESVLTSGKAYNDSYNEDLFGHNEYGCAYITYDKLIERKLLKDIEMDGITCNSNKTYIRVIKQKDKYGYKTYLTCGKKKEDGTMGKIYNTIPNEIPEMDKEACTGTDDNNLSVTADMTEANGKADKVKKKTKIKISSGTGIESTIVLYAKWSQNTDDHNDAGFTKVNFKVKENQEQKLLNGELITTQSKELLTPDGNGDYYLIVRVDYLRDLYGHNWKNPDNTNSKYLSFGPFTIDSTPSEITTLVYKCDSEGNKIGEALATKKVTNGSGQVFDISNISGNVNNWLTSSNYMNGVCLGFEISDNLSIKTAKLEQNSKGKKDKSIGYKNFNEDKTWTQSYESGLTSKTIYKQINEDGIRYLRFMVKDYAGHKTSMDIEFNYDKTPPTKPTITNATAGIWTNKNVNLTLGSTDSIIGMGEYYYSYNGGATTFGSDSNTQWVKLNGGTDKTSFTTEPWTNNIDKETYIRACDKLGNCSQSNSTRIKIDKTAPAAPTIISTSNGNWVNTDVLLTLNAQDTAAGINTCAGIGEYYYSYNGGATTTGTDSSNQWVKLKNGTDKTSFTTEPWTVEVNKQFNKTTYIRVCDKVGNCSSSNSTDIKMDKKPPTKPTITNPTDGNWTNTNFKLTIKSSDNGGVGIKNYQYSYASNPTAIGSNTSNQWVVDGTSSSTSYTSTDYSAERNQYTYWRVCDQLDNCSETEKTMIRIDKTKPTCGTVNKTTTYDRNGVDGTVGCSDSASGCTKNTYSFENKKESYSVEIKDTAGNKNYCVSISSEKRTEEELRPYTYNQSVFVYAMQSDGLSWDNYWHSKVEPKYVCQNKGCKFKTDTQQGCSRDGGINTWIGYKWDPSSACQSIYYLENIADKCITYVVNGKEEERCNFRAVGRPADACRSWTSLGKGCYYPGNGSQYEGVGCNAMLPWVQVSGGSGLGSCWYDCTSKCDVWIDTGASVYTFKVTSYMKYTNEYYVYY